MYPDYYEVLADAQSGPTADDYSDYASMNWKPQVHTGEKLTLSGWQRKDMSRAGSPAIDSGKGRTYRAS